MKIHWFLTAALALGLLASAPLMAEHAGHEDENGAMHMDEKYACPMHPEVKSDKPGKCPKCEMNLVETTKEAHKHS